MSLHCIFKINKQQVILVYSMEFVLISKKSKNDVKRKIMNIAIVVSDFNHEITHKMLAVSQKKAKLLKLKINYECHVLGAYDMPLVISALLQKKDVDGVVTLGAIIKGQTKHDEVIAHSTARALTDLSIKYQKPVSLGISGPGMQEKHAYARVRPVSELAVESIVKIREELEKIK